jgi:crotonobetainyl-CoA:carnitine CoA-transferase CaiB-like acyl-CoA transferase
MGTFYLAQGSNKRSIGLDLKHPAAQDIVRRLAERADIFLENYRPGAFKALGLGYDDLARLNPRLIYCSISAFGQDGPRGSQTGYDNVIQAASGIMAMTGTPEVNPVKLGSPVLDYSTGFAGAFALSSALFQRERTGKGQYIDLAMLDTALMLMSSHVTSYTVAGREPAPTGNAYHFATMGGYATADGMVMLGASNMRQQKRLWQLIERPDMIKTTTAQRIADRAREAALLADFFRTKTSREWEEFLLPHRIPVSRVRKLSEALADPQLERRGLLHRHAAVPGTERPYAVPMAAFKFAHGGPSIETPPPTVGADTEAILGELGFKAQDIAALRAAGTI